MKVLMFPEHTFDGLNVEVVTTEKEGWDGKVFNLKHNSPKAYREKKKEDWQGKGKRGKKYYVG